MVVLNAIFTIRSFNDFLFRTWKKYNRKEKKICMTKNPNSLHEFNAKKKEIHILLQMLLTDNAAYLGAWEPYIYRSQNSINRRVVVNMQWE